jgi:hypothetical protein
MSNDEETDEPLIADHRNFYKVEKWSRDGERVTELLFAGSSLDKAKRVFDRYRHRMAPCEIRSDWRAFGAGRVRRRGGAALGCKGRSTDTHHLRTYCRPGPPFLSCAGLFFLPASPLRHGSSGRPSLSFPSCCNGRTQRLRRREVRRRGGAALGSRQGGGKRRSGMAQCK